MHAVLRSLHNSNSKNVNCKIGQIKIIQTNLQEGKILVQFKLNGLLIIQINKLNVNPTRSKI